MIDLNAYLYLVTLVEEGSFAKASKKLYITPNTLRKNIELFEQEIGYEIFERTNKGVLLTPDGHFIYKHALSLVEQAHIIETELIHNKRNTNQIKIASFASHAISEQFFKFYQNNLNQNEFYLEECGTKEAINKVINNEINLAIVYYCEKQQNEFKNYIKKNNLKFAHLFNGELKVLVTNNSCLNTIKEINADHLNNKILIIRNYEDDTFLGLRQEISRLGIKPRKTMVLNGNNFYAALYEPDAFAICPIWNHEKFTNPNINCLSIGQNKNIACCGYVYKQSITINNEIIKLLNNISEEYS